MSVFIPLELLTPLWLDIPLVSPEILSSAGNAYTIWAEVYDFSFIYNGLIFISSNILS